MNALFGKFGIRGNVADELSVDSALRLGRAIGRYFNGEVAVVSDKNDTSKMTLRAIISGLLSYGCNVKDLGVLPTHILRMFVRNDDDIIGGVSVTDPDEDGNVTVNLIFGDGTVLVQGAEDKIKSFYKENDLGDPEKQGRIRQYVNPLYDYYDSITRYINYLLVKEYGLKMVMDCASSTASPVITELLDMLGVKSLILNGHPGPSEDISLEDRLKRVSELVVSTGANAGAVLDKDGSKVRFVSENGTILSDDQTFDVFIKNELSKGSAPVIYTTYSMDVVKNFIFTNGGTPIKVHYGIDSIVDAIKDKKAVIGGEYYDVVFPNHQLCVDPGIMIAKLMEAITKFGSIQNIISSLPSRSKMIRIAKCPDGMKSGVFDLIRDIHMLYAKEDEYGFKLQFDDCTMYVIDRDEGEIALVAESMFEKVTESRIEGVLEEIEKYVNS